LGKVTSIIEGEEVKFQLKQVFEKIVDIRGSNRKETMVSQNTFRGFLPSTPVKFRQKGGDGRSSSYANY
jgi:hypothetical protein